LRHSANNETSKQRKTEALKRLQVVESFRESNLNQFFSLEKVIRPINTF